MEGNGQKPEIPQKVLRSDDLVEGDENDGLEEYRKHKVFPPEPNSHEQHGTQLGKKSSESQNFPQHRSRVRARQIRRVVEE